MNIGRNRSWVGRLTGWLLLTTLLTVLLSAGAAQAQGVKGAAAHVQWEAEAVPEAVSPGEQLHVALTATIGEGWKMYALDSPAGAGIPVSVELEDLPAAMQAGAVEQDPPKEGYDPNFDKVVRYFTEQARLRAEVEVSEAVKPGKYELGGTVTYMICNDRMCLPPTRAPFVTSATVRNAAAQGAAASAETSSPGESDAEDEATAAAGTGTTTEPPPETARDPAAGLGMAGSAAGGSSQASGLWGFLLLAAGAGLAALLTPCVFPMIPLTVSYFTKHSGNRSEAVRMAGVYGFTIVLTFTGLGVLTALLVGAAGAQTIAANPWINLFIGLIFVVFALSLLGLFELRLPAGLLNYFNRQSNEQGGYSGVFFMGLTLTLVSFSCTAPFVGGLLAATAQGEWAYPVVGMLVFSGVFSLPFVVFALFPNGLQALPRSGGWMNAVKVTLGFIELAAALKFLSNADLVWGWGLISRPLAIALAVVIFFLAGLYLLGKLPLKHEPPVEHVGVGRLLASIAFFGLALYLLPGLFGAPLGRLDAYLPPRQAGEVSLVAAMPPAATGANTHDGFAWHEDMEAAFEQARAENKPVFIDFTGYTCTNCREMEANVFPKPEVAQRFQNDFVLLRLYTDDRTRGPEYQRYQLRLTGTVALPTYAIVRPEGEKLLARTSGMTPILEFVAFLDRGVTSFANGALAAADR